MSIIDLSTAIRHTHVSSLTQGDLNTWANEVEGTEAQRDRFEGECHSLTGRVVEVLDDLDAMRRKRDAWRFLSLLGLGIWILFALAACSGSQL